MADKGFGVKKINLIGASGTPTLTSPNNLNLNAVNVAISTDVSIGGTCTAYEFDGAIASWMVGNDGTDHYTFRGSGISTQVNDPELNLVKGQKYIFHNRSSGHPFRIQSTANGSTGTQYNTGVTNNDGSAPTDIVFDVPQDAPDTLYYQCANHPSMGGKFIIDKSNAPEINSQTTSYTVQKSDVGKIIEIASNVNLSVNLTNKSTSGWVNGDSFQILTNSSQSTTLNAVPVSLYWATGSSYSTGPRTLNAYSLVTLTYFDNDKWFLTGNGIQ